MLRLKVSWSMSSPGEQFLGHLFSELDAPLVVAVDVPDDALHEHLVLVERDQPAEVLRRAALEREDAAGPVAGILPVERKLGVVGAESKGIGLGARGRAELGVQPEVDEIAGHALRPL